jgi:hypothetical protein
VCMCVICCVLCVVCCVCDKEGCRPCTTENTASCSFPLFYPRFNQKAYRHTRADEPFDEMCNGFLYKLPKRKKRPFPLHHRHHLRPNTEGKKKVVRRPLFERVACVCNANSSSFFFVSCLLLLRTPLRCVLRGHIVTKVKTHAGCARERRPTTAKTMSFSGESTRRKRREKRKR